MSQGHIEAVLRRAAQNMGPGGSQCPKTSPVLVPAPVFPFTSGCCFSRSGTSIVHHELGQRQDEVAFTGGSEICFC